MTFIVLYLLFVWSDVTAEIFCAWMAYRSGSQLGKPLCLLFAGLALNNIFALIAIMGRASAQTPPDTWFLCWYWSGRIVKTIAVWWYAFFTTGFNLNKRNRGLG